MSDPYRAQKNAFSRYPTGIAVVSCLTQTGQMVGITINSYTSVSLDPTLILWCLDKGASQFDSFMQADHYAISVLSAEQRALSDRFASPETHNIAPDEADVFVSGAPLLPGRLAGFDCRVADRHGAGDHVILIGQVEHFDSFDGAPLIYSGRQYLTGPKIAD